MTILYYDGQIVGATDCELITLTPSIEILEREHPRRRFVSMLAIYAVTIAEGRYPGHYRTADAYDFARCMLMPAGEFLTLAERSDCELAEHFAVPRDQVAVHRGQLIACHGDHGCSHPPLQGPGAL